MMERSVIVTLAQALDIAERFEPDRVGVVVDAYHVWWDPELYRQISRASGRIFGFHADDWLPPKPELLLSRAMMGDGPIEIRRIREAVDTAGYAGPIEVEIFNQDIWSAPGDEVLALTKERGIYNMPEGLTTSIPKALYLLDGEAFEKIYGE